MNLRRFVLVLVFSLGLALSGGVQLGGVRHAHADICTAGEGCPQSAMVHSTPPWHRTR